MVQTGASLPFPIPVIQLMPKEVQLPIVLLP
uniref:Uncharacterized protein n=1 Tax=Caudovirales sp. ctUL28 TaxID=2826778 RepID=A0A8S5MVL0_9CAUD|nr:MAG TPA: hypothetical protein [Caudovirales sp. ctUL28]